MVCIYQPSLTLASFHDEVQNSKPYRINNLADRSLPFAVNKIYDYTPFIG